MAAEHAASIEEIIFNSSHFSIWLKSSLTTGRGPIKDSENLVINQDYKMDPEISYFFDAASLAVHPQISVKKSLNLKGCKHIFSS